MSRQTTHGRFGFDKSISHRNSVMETKVPDLCQLCQKLTVLYLQMFLDTKSYLCILFKISASALLPPQGFGPDGRNLRSHHRSPRAVYREEYFAVPEKLSIFENTARKGLPKARWR